jgi:uncharacterized protein YceK
LGVVSLAAALAVSGCGTTINVWAGGNCIPYGGAATDAAAVLGGLASVTGLMEAEGEIDRPTWLLLAAGGIVDFPFSVLGDTATLPITLRSTLEQIRKPTVEPETTTAEKANDPDRKPTESPTSPQEPTPNAGSIFDGKDAMINGATTSRSR